MKAMTVPPVCGYIRLGRLKNGKASKDNMTSEMYKALPAAHMHLPASIYQRAKPLPDIPSIPRMVNRVSICRPVV
eukprot:12913696-Prorocentrum_lima.AAC.1